MTAATATYSATMPDLRGDPAPSSLWSNYAGPIHMSPRMGGVGSGVSPMEPGRSHVPTSLSLHTSSLGAAAARPRSDQDYLSQAPPPPPQHQPYPYTRYPLPEPEPSPQSAYPTNSLKRSFSQTQSPPAQDSLHHREAAQRTAGAGGAGGAGGHDQKLLAFRRAEDKTAITDQQGRLQQLDVSAQLHGMFFLSEMPSNASDGTALQPELTCYRRNLFQIGGSLMTPRGPLSALTESGQSLPINSMEVTISAIESVDGNPVRLVVIPWKTPPPNSPEVSQAPDQEPPALPLVPVQDGGPETDGVCAYYAIGWRRLQFRIATANNGRRKELQQHFVLHLKVHGTLADNSKVVLTEYTTAPIVVRGRSPRNFQSRKEIPLLGSSAGSRGQSLVETGMGVVTGHMGMKPAPSTAAEVKPDMRVPRSSFSFEPPKAAAQAPARHGSFSGPYTSWSPTSHGPLPQVSTAGADAYPATAATTMPSPADMYPKVGYPTDSHEMQPLQTSLGTAAPLPLISEEHAQQQQPMRQPSYPYTAGAPSGSTPRQMPMATTTAGLPATTTTAAAPPDDTSLARFVGGDDRPLKRNTGPQGITGSDTEYRYGPYGGVPATTQGYSPTRDVYARGTSTAGQSPTTTVGPYGTAGSDPRAYAVTPYDAYDRTRRDDVRKLDEGQTGHGHSPVHPGEYGQHRGSFDAMSHYSWNNP